MRTLVLDVGGTHVKMLVSGGHTPRKFASGTSLTPAELVKQVKNFTADWSYDRISIGYPGLVVHGRIAADPKNLGAGWMGFDFHKAFRCPVIVINDAAMQALGSYSGGRMLFLGLGTGLGSAMIVDGVLEPMELAHLPYRRGKTYEDYLGVAGLKRLGHRKWLKHVWKVVGMLQAALEPEYIVIGGGDVKKLKRSAPHVRLGRNGNAFIGGIRLWNDERPRPERKGREVARKVAGGSK